MKSLITICFFMMSCIGLNAQAKPATLTEEQKITQLITYVKNLKGAVFIRNGSEHSAIEAASHLEKKRKNAGKAITTAADFISLCATKSSMTGEEYKIRLSDGKVLRSADLLSKELNRIQQSSKK